MHKTVFGLLLAIGFLTLVQAATLSHAEECVINSFTVNSTKLMKGQSLTTSWNTAGCTRIFISGNDAIKDLDAPASGTKTVQADSSFTVSINALKPGGGEVSKKEAITVIDPSHCTATLTLNKATAQAADQVSANYSVSGCLKAILTVTDTVTGAAIHDPYPISVNYGGQGGGLTFSGIKGRTLVKLDAYVEDTLTVTKEAYVDLKVVSAEPCTLNSFAFDKSSIVKGSSTILRWDSSAGCSMATLYENNKFLVQPETDGNRSVSPTYTSTYRLIVGKSIAAIDADKTITLTVTETADVPPADPIVVPPVETPGFPVKPPVITPVEETPGLPIINSDPLKGDEPFSFGGFLSALFNFSQGGEVQQVGFGASGDPLKGGSAQTEATAGETSSLAPIRAQSEAYRDLHGNFAGMCADPEIVRLLNMDSACRAAPSAWAVSARLSTGQYYCMDSAGRTIADIGAHLAADAFACPVPESNGWSDDPGVPSDGAPDDDDDPDTSFFGKIWGFFKGLAFWR